MRSSVTPTCALRPEAGSLRVSYQLCSRRFDDEMSLIMITSDLLQVSALQALDSGIELSDDIESGNINRINKRDGDEFIEMDKFSLCSSCTSSIPKVMTSLSFLLGLFNI